MQPGYYGNVPYFSPIYIYEVQPLKSGRSLLDIRFYNAFYAQGVQDFEKQLKILKRTSVYLLAELIEPSMEGERICIIRDIGFGWLKNVNPSAASYIEDHPQEPNQDIQSYLSKHLLGK
jgi:hypothetical protein